MLMVIATYLADFNAGSILTLRPQSFCGCKGPRCVRGLMEGLSSKTKEGPSAPSASVSHTQRQEREQTKSGLRVGSEKSRSKTIKGKNTPDKNVLPRMIFSPSSFLMQSRSGSRATHSPLHCKRDHSHPGLFASSSFSSTSSSTKSTADHLVITKTH